MTTKEKILQVFRRTTVLRRKPTSTNSEPQARIARPGMNSYWAISPRDKPIFVNELSNGYTEVAFHTNWGPWVGDERLMGVWVFFHPSEKMAAWGFAKANDGGHTRHCEPQRREYNDTQARQAFFRMLQTFEVTLSERIDLAGFIQKLASQPLPEKQNT